MGIYRDMFVKHHDRLGLLGDIGAIWSVGYLATQLRFPGTSVAGAPIHEVILYFSCTVAFIVLPLFDLYTFWRFRVAANHADAQTATPEGVPRLDELDQVPKFAREHQVDEIWITLPSNAIRQVQSIAYALRNDFIDIKWIPSLTEFQPLNHRISEFTGMHPVEPGRPPALGVRGLVKVLFDRTFAALILIALSPLFLAIAIQLKRSSLPQPTSAKRDLDWTAMCEWTNRNAY